MYNPWLGLSSYTEETLTDHQFNGRSVAVASLVSLIQRNLFVTVYGRSGVGKTSLLQAGVFPVLKHDGFFPLVIRLNYQKDGDIPLSKIIWETTLSVLHSKGYKFKPCDSEDVYNPDFTETTCLRQLFSSGRFLNNEGDEAIPVIVLDQFEEALYKTPASSKMLIPQLYALIDDNYNFHVSHPNWHDDTNFRMVISIREDDLFLFEDLIDSFNCADFKNNRYRLRPLSDEEAKEVILNPINGKHVFREDEEESIAEEIINISKGKGSSINTLLLSLTCYTLYDNCASPDKPIALSDLKDYKNSLETYYKNVINKIPKSERYYLENHLIDEKGRRNPIYLSDIEKFAPKAIKLIENSNQRLLVENQGRVELIHDQLADTILKIRDARKSKKSKRYGVFILIAFLLVMFFISFSRLPDHNKLYKNIPGLINDTKVTSAVIRADTLTLSYNINDCPSLKSIDIVGNDGHVNIYNCPNLVNVSYPKNFSGSVTIYNCPNVKPDNIIKEYEFNNSFNYTKYRSQAPINTGDSKTPTYVFNYDNLANRITVNMDPVMLSKYGKYKYTTDLPDSIKRITDCYVPFGQKEHFSQLIEYQPFRSINELPVYHTWKSNFQGMYKFFLAEKTWKSLALMGLYLILFISISYISGRYRNTYKNVFTVFILSLLYGIGMTLLGALSFMAFYWSVYNLILQDQIISTLVGSVGCLTCLLFVYKNAFGKFWRHLKNLWKDIKTNGLSVIFKRIEHTLTNLPKQLKASVKQTNEKIKKSPEYFKRNRRAILLRGLIVIALATTILLYINGYNKRKYYLTELNKIIERGEYARANGIVQELIDQHSWFLYPNLSKNLNSLKKKIPNEKILSTQLITPEHINNIATKQNTSLEISDIELLSFSEDAKKLVIRVKYPNVNDLQNDSFQAIMLDLNRQSIVTLTQRSQSEWYYKSSFSPSGNYLIVSDSEGQYSFSTKNKIRTDVSNKFAYNSPDDIIMIDDSVFYFTHWGTLYKNSLTSKEAPKEINQAKGIYKNLKMITGNLIGGIGDKDEIIIYDTLKDSVYFHSKNRNAGDLRYINKDYAITSKGLYDLKLDSLVNGNNFLFHYKDNVVNLQNFDDNSYFCNLKGHRIALISTPRDNIYLSYNIKFSKNGKYMIVQSYNNIIIYDLSATENLNQKVSDRDKKMFDLK